MPAVQLIKKLDSTARLDAEVKSPPALFPALQPVKELESNTSEVPSTHIPPPFLPSAEQLVKALEVTVVEVTPLA